MKSVDLSVVEKYSMPSGLGDLDKEEACVVAQAAIVDSLCRGESIANLTDSLNCACPVLRTLAIAMNDVAWWKDAEERTSTLRPLIPLLLDSIVSPDATAKRAALASGFAQKAAQSAKSAESAAKYAAKYAVYAAKSAKYAAKYAKYAAKSAKYAAESAVYAAEYAVSAAYYAAQSAEYAVSAAKSAAQSAAQSVLPLREELLRVWMECEIESTKKAHPEKDLPPESSNFMRSRWMDYIDGECGPNGGSLKKSA